MSIFSSRRSHRISVIDYLHDTSVDGKLYDSKYEQNNNFIGFTSFHHFCDDRPMTVVDVEYNNNYNNNIYQHTSITTDLSPLLNANEQKSVLNYVGEDAELLAVGVCQLLESHDNEWVAAEQGVLCLIKDRDRKIYSLSLLIPSADYHPATVSWCKEISREFQTSKSHEHLVTFEIPDTSLDHLIIYGCNFIEPFEAENFHQAVQNQYESYIMRKQQRDRKQPKRQAPAPPPQDIELPYNLPMAESVSLDNIGATPVGVQVPGKAKDAEKKKGFFKSMFASKKDKKKKKKGKMDISQPTNFIHMNTLRKSELEEMSPEQQEALKILMAEINFNPDNEHQIEALKNIAMTRHEEVRKSRTHREKRQREDSPELVERPNAEVFERQDSALANTRSSIKIQRGSNSNTPRGLKKHSSNRKSGDTPVDRPPTPAPEGLGRRESADPLHTDWDQEPSPMRAGPSSTTTTTRTDMEEEENLPPVPNRTVSRRANLHRQNTPPNPMLSNRRQNNSPPPRLSSRTNSHTPIPTISTPPPQLYQRRDSRDYQPDPPCSLDVIAPISSSAPPPPPLPAGGVSSIQTPVVKREPQSSNHLSPTTPTSSISPERRSLLEEIQSVNVSVLRHVDVDESKPSKKQGNGSIMDSIQVLIDNIRPQIGGSDSEDSDDSSTSWDD